MLITDIINKFTVHGTWRYSVEFIMSWPAIVHCSELNEFSLKGGLIW